MKIIIFNFLTHTGKKDDGDRKAHGNTDTIDNTLDKIIALLYIRKSHAENGAVRRNQGKIYAQRFVKAYHVLLQEHFHKLYQCSDHQDKDNRLQILNPQLHEHKVIDQARARCCDRDNEDNRRAHTGSCLCFLGNAKERAQSEELA